MTTMQHRLKGLNSPFHFFQQLLYTLLFISLSSLSFGQTIFYVKMNGNGNQSGDSWENAFASIQEAITAAKASADDDKQIWVAEGIYLPIQTLSGSTDIAEQRNFTFYLDFDVKIYGGFSNMGDPDNIEDRDWEAHRTILSGDFMNNDEYITDMEDENFPATNNDENAYTILHTKDVSEAFVLDGFYFEGGNANGSSGDFLDPSKNGGAWYNNGSNGNSSKPTIVNCSFSGNSADLGGGMFNNRFSRPTLSNCSFSGNSADGGGGMVNFSNSSPTLSNCSFSGNLANLQGGGMFNVNSSPTLSNCSFSGNSAASGDGMYNVISSPTLSNCSFSGNSAASGGGMSNESNSSPTLNNCLIWNNQAQSGTETQSASISGDFTANYSLIQGYASTANNNLDGTDPNNAPLFVQPVDLMDVPTTAGNLRLEPCSFVINQGNNGGLSMDDVDLAGQPRIIDGTVDLGAYEFQGDAIAPVIGMPSTTTITTTTDSDDMADCAAVVAFELPALSDNFSLIPCAQFTYELSGATTLAAKDIGVFDGSTTASEAFMTGLSTITFKATDATGNTAMEQSITVMVTDNESPQINCPADMPVNTDAGECDAVVTFTAPVGTDNCSPTTSRTDMTGLNSGDAFPIGTTVLSYQVTDGNLTDNCSFSIIVTDNENPDISCPSHISQNADPDQCGAIVTFDEPIGTDNCANPVTTRLSALGSGDFFPFGETTVTYRVTDAADLIKDCSFMVTIIDNVGLEITGCPSEQFAQLNENCEITLPDYRNFATITSNCTAPELAITQTPAPQSMPMEVGIAEIIISAMNVNGGNDQCSFDLNICPPSFIDILNVDMNSVENGDYSSIETQVRICTDSTFTITEVTVVGDAGERQAFADLSFDLDGGETLDCIVIANETGGALAVDWLDFAATLLDDQTVDLQWWVASDEAVDFYQIERSADGQNFSTRYQLYIDESNSHNNTFKYKDAAPWNGNNYYRIVQYDKNGTTTVSPTRLVKVLSQKVLVYPNPTHDHFQLVLPKVFQEASSFRLFQTDGRLIYEGTLAAQQQRFEWSATALGISYSGIYILEIILPTGKVDMIKLEIL